MSTASLGIGLVGVGFMGHIHFQAAKRLSQARVAALVSRDPVKRAGDWTAIRGNFGPPGQQEDLSQVTTHESLDGLLTDDAVDVVDVCLPTDLHPDVCIAALEAGKHVLCEKAIALTVAEADRMVAAAAAADRRLLVMHVLPFFADFRKALEIVQEGEHGTLRAAHFRRHISPPDWSGDIADASRTGGPIVDLHVHDTHFVAALCGKPRAVFSTGIDVAGSVDYVATQYLYDGGPVVSATSGAISAAGRPFTHGFELYLERATLRYEAGGPLHVYTADSAGEADLDDGDEIDAFAAEMTAALHAIRTGEPCPLLEGELARDALALCHAEAASVRSGEKVSL